MPLDPVDDVTWVFTIQAEPVPAEHGTRHCRYFARSGSRKTFC